MIGTDELTIRLNNISDSYYGFVAAVLTYVKQKQSRFEAVVNFMDGNPGATTSDILLFISNQDDFYEDIQGQRVNVG